mmetsp:Transcript_122034/g.193359  ORF Transcript_122034/g.193359 Transcript_122034/m.193359 type:complete len:512 (+) Transcript_122034:40-1575(+)
MCTLAELCSESSKTSGRQATETKLKPQDHGFANISDHHERGLANDSGALALTFSFRTPSFEGLEQQPKRVQDASVFSAARACANGIPGLARDFTGSLLELRSIDSLLSSKEQRLAKSCLSNTLLKPSFFAPAGFHVTLGGRSLSNRSSSSRTFCRALAFSNSARLRPKSTSAMWRCSLNDSISRRASSCIDSKHCVLATMCTSRALSSSASFTSFSLDSISRLAASSSARNNTTRLCSAAICCSYRASRASTRCNRSAIIRSFSAAAATLSIEKRSASSLSVVSLSAQTSSLCRRSTRMRSAADRSSPMRSAARREASARLAAATVSNAAWWAGSSVSTISKISRYVAKTRRLFSILSACSRSCDLPASVGGPGSGGALAHGNQEPVPTILLASCCNIPTGARPFSFLPSLCRTISSCALRMDSFSIDPFPRVPIKPPASSASLLTPGLEITCVESSLLPQASSPSHKPSCLAHLPVELFHLCGVFSDSFSGELLSFRAMDAAIHASNWWY